MTRYTLYALAVLWGVVFIGIVCPVSYAQAQNKRAEPPVEERLATVETNLANIERNINVLRQDLSEFRNIMVASIIGALVVTFSAMAGIAVYDRHAIEVKVTQRLEEKINSLSQYIEKRTSDLENSTHNLINEFNVRMTSELTRAITSIVSERCIEIEGRIRDLRDNIRNDIEKTNSSINRARSEIQAHVSSLDSIVKHHEYIIKRHYEDQYPR